MCTAQKCPDLAGTGGLLYSCPSAEDHGVCRAASLLGQMDSFCLWVGSTISSKTMVSVGVWHVGRPDWQLITCRYEGGFNISDRPDSGKRTGQRSERQYQKLERAE